MRVRGFSRGWSGGVGVGAHWGVGLYGPIVHAPLGGSTEEARQS